MARYTADQNKVLGIHESGTYATPMAGSSFWIGQVISNSIDDNENKIPTRYLGTSTRSIDTMDEGVRDVTGTVTYRNQNFMMAAYAIGSIAETTSGTNIMLYTTSEVGTNVAQSAFTSGSFNPPLSFTIEDSKQAPGTNRNFMRTINGCVPNTVSITASSSEVVSTDLDYLGQTLTFSSGTTTAVTEITNSPYAFGDTSLTMAGSSITAKEITLEINQNIEGPHYLNGSRDIATPFAGNRDYSLSVTMDLDSAMAAVLYNTYYKSTSSFNTVLDFNKDVTATGSQHAIFTLSGCHISSMDNPSENEGVTETSMDVIVEKVGLVEYTRDILHPY